MFIFSLFCLSLSLSSIPSSLFPCHFFFNLRGPLFPHSSLSKSHTDNKTTIWLFSITFITQMMNNHLCCQSTNMSGYRNKGLEAGSPKQFKIQPDSHLSCLNNSMLHLYRNTFTSATTDDIVSSNSSNLSLLRKEIHQM